MDPLLESGSGFMFVSDNPTASLCADYMDCKVCVCVWGGGGEAYSIQISGKRGQMGHHKWVTTDRSPQMVNHKWVPKDV